jgi:aerobic-type carbon monoxide dehydrogenase small subunit (CoxS/CutS family)
MSEKSKPRGITRRKFLKNIGAGVVGTTVAINSLKAGTKDPKSKDPTSPHQHKVPLSLQVNGQNITTLVEPQTSLADFLRDQLHLTGTKIVCNHGECGACTVLLDNKAVYSCHMLALDAANRSVITIEGLMSGEELHPLQQAFVEHDGMQCGFCTPGQIMAAQALLLKNPHPSREEVMTGMSGNLCRCAAYPHIIESVLAASEK